jgi:hypothetical protein
MDEEKKQFEGLWQKAKILRNSAILAQYAADLNGGNPAEAITNLMMAAIMVVLPVKKREVTDEMVMDGLRESLGHAENLFPLLKEFVEWMQVQRATTESGESTIQ